MSRLRLLSAAEQVAAHLRDELQRGTWTGEMPGAKQLTMELGVNHKTVEAALVWLEKEGVLVSQGARRRRRIDLSGSDGSGRSLRIAILLFESGDRRSDYMVEIRHELIEAGHAPFYASRTLEDLGMDVPSVAHIRLDSEPWVRHVVRWASKVSRGERYVRQVSSKAEFVPGGTIGPVKG